MKCLLICTRRVYSAVDLAPAKQVHAVAFEIDGRVYEGRPGETHARLLARLPASVVDRYYDLMEDPDEAGFVDGFIMKNGEFLTRGDVMMRTGKPGESTTQGVSPRR